ncbi:esterase-like activity of phytase family protein [Altererythrobacter lutimaris]|uniref:Esterase-like activity of phytase family protein n=1 Tax=Altererythrobacter lutimaris TaxID=2743979 RepID=A0A850HEL9_9SPHN|nr:esterase-like activity of phytase family protein [Altererythrobacter lutimaris]NVE95338.1 esterase-like activity of phytase family protein [Altererythrobacter lutimaris]
MIRRLILLGCVVAALTPGTWVRSPTPPIIYDAPLIIKRIEPTGSFASDSLTFDAAWKLTSQSAHFGGYSGLVALNETTLLAGSDKARLLTLPIPGRGGGKPVMDFLKPNLGQRRELPRELVDLEALTRDPETDALWASYENTQTIERHSPDGTIAERDPPEMLDWPMNGGPEVLQRLPDGRFLVLAEAPEGRFATGTAGLLFERDPVEEQEPLAFRFPDLEGLSPVDAAMLPDGRVMILLRDIRLQWPIRFRSALAIADPSTIEEGEVWGAEIIARFSGPGLDANFEGLASIPSEDGSAELYVIADDNFSNLQETLLLRLIWRPSD